MQQGEDTKVQNIRTKERQIEKAVIESINLVEKSVSGIKPTENDLKWNITDDFSNPTKEEIVEQLVRIPAMQAFYSNMKIYAQLLLDIAEHELYVAQVNAREEYKSVFQQRLKNYETEISNRMADALRSTAQDIAMMAVKEMIKTLKPKDPTDKDIEAYIKGKTAAQERQVIIHKYRYNKLREFCKILENKFLSVRALRYSLEESDKSNNNVSKTS